MTTLSSEPVADGKQAFTSLRRLRSSVLLVSLPFGMILLGLPLVAREMGASALIIGGLLSVSALIIVVVQPIIGLGLDRYGRRPFLIMGLPSYAFSNAVFGLASGIRGLYLAQLAQGYSQTSPHRSLQLLLRHDDSEREYAYDGGAEKAQQLATVRNWQGISMQRDFVQVFAFA